MHGAADMTRLTRVPFVCALVCVCAGVLCTPRVWADECRRATTGDICAQGSPWAAFTQLRLRLGVDEHGQTITVTTHGADDFSMDLEDESQKPGRMIVVSGLALLMKDVEHEPGYEIDAIDGPMLLQQLVVVLLDRAFPDGPASIGATAPIKIRQAERAIHVVSPGAELRLAAPWTLSGAAHRASGRIEYDVEFVFTGEGSEKSMHFTGFWQQASAPTALDDRMPLDGWTVLLLGPLTPDTKEGTLLDDGAKPATGRWADLRALRKYIADASRR